MSTTVSAAPDIWAAAHSLGFVGLLLSAGVTGFLLLSERSGTGIQESMNTQMSSDEPVPRAPGIGRSPTSARGISEVGR